MDSEPFGHVEMFGHELMTSFTPADAQAFAKRAELAKAQLK